jgi:exopolysaccharide production protein ExoZ
MVLFFLYFSCQIQKALINIEITPVVKPESIGLKERKTELTGIQYLRGIAALWVVLTHTASMGAMPKYFNFSIVNGWLRGGAVGVELFFAISGFIIIYVSLATKTLSPLSTVKSFLKKRIIRIIPFMWACIIGYALLRLVGRSNGSFPGLEYLRAMFLIPVGKLEPNVIWTLRHEFLFYMIFCFTMMTHNKKWALIVLWFASPLILYSFADRSSMEGNPVAIELLFFVFNKVNLLFFTGFLIGFLFLKGYLQKQITSNHGFLICLAACIPLFVIASFLKPDFEAAHPLVYIALIAVPVALVLRLGIALRPDKTPNLLSRLGMLLGDASYSIYLTHSAIISSILGVWSKYQKIPNAAALLTCTIICCCIGGILVHKFVEKPLIRFIQLKMKK